MEHELEKNYYIRNGKKIKKATASTPITDKADLFKITDTFRADVKSKELHEKYLMLWELSVGLGFRISDTLPLTVADVTGNDTEITEKKTGKRRMLVLNERLQALTDRYIKKYNLKPDDKLIFANNSSGIKTKSIDRSQAYRKLKEEVQKVCPDIRFSNHTCRKTWAYMLYLANDKNIAIVQKALNHSSSLTTADYIGLSKKELREKLTNFDPLS